MKLKDAIPYKILLESVFDKTSLKAIFMAGGPGGAGAPNNINNSCTTYAGGGGGGAGSASAGGSGGGGAETAGNSGAGGKGVIIISVPTANYSNISTGSPTVTTSGSNTILQFNGDGSYTA